MKLGLVVPGGVDRSGTERVIPCLLWLIERLARRHQVHVFALQQQSRRPGRYGLLGATVHDIGQSPPTRLRALTTMLAEHRRAPFDLLHGFWAGRPGMIAAIAGRMLRRPVLLHLAGGELVALEDIGYGGRLTRRGRLWTDLSLRGATRITAASAPMLDLAATSGVRAERLPFGVDLVRWPPLQPRPRAPGRPARLLHVASLNRVKDQRTLLAAAAKLRDAGLDFRLDIIGEDTLAGAVHALAHSLGLSPYVTLMGFLPHDRLRPLVAAADVLLVSSRHEAGPLVTLEAAVAGVPTVGTAVGHIREWAPEAAVAVPVADADALARETLALLGDDARRVEIAREAQRRATEEDADWTAARVETTYQILTARR